MDILITALQALGQVLVVGILLGAGLPALFALGIRALNTNRTVVAAVVASERRKQQTEPGCHRHRRASASDCASSPSSAASQSSSTASECSGLRLQARRHSPARPTVVRRVSGLGPVRHREA